MKSTLLIILLTLGLLPVFSSQAQARHCSQNSHVFISGYQRCGAPIYKVRYIAGYDRCGRAIWRVRGLNCRERSRYVRPYSRNVSRSYSSRHAGYGSSRITYSSSGGHHYSYYRYQRAPGGCRVW